MENTDPEVPAGTEGPPSGAPTPPEPRSRPGCLEAVNTRAAHLNAWVEHSPLIKLLVVLWLVAQSLYGPASCYFKERDQARREGLAEEPRVRVLVSPDGRCIVANRDPRPIVALEVHRFIHESDTSGYCLPYGGFAGEARDIGCCGTPQIEAGATFFPKHVPLSPLTDSRMSRCLKADTCSLLVECEATFYRAADRKRFERVGIGSVSVEGTVDYPPIGIHLEEGESAAKITVARNPQLKAAWRCIKEDRDLRKGLQTLQDQLFTGVDAVTKPEGQ